MRLVCPHSLSLLFILMEVYAVFQADLAEKILFEPLRDEAEELYILSAYATPICFHGT